MITIFHGVNTPASRKSFTSSREHVQNPVTLDGAKTTLSDLAQVLSGQALFAEEKNVFIEEFYSKRKKSKETETILHFILEHQKENSIFIWESKELTPAQIKSFKNAQVQKFDLPKHIFAFLESIVPKNSQKAITLFHKTLETEEAEFVFFMIVRHIRILLALQSLTLHPLPMEEEQAEGQQIDEVKRMQPWLKGKTAKQAHSFSLENLLHVYNNLFTIETGLKTGTLPTNLTQAIDFLLINL